MKVFVPVTDEILRNADAAVETNLVPFNPEYLRARADRDAVGFRPSNWISSNDYASAKARLRASMPVHATS